MVQTVLVTGAAGGFGSTLVRHLTVAGYGVRALARENDPINLIPLERRYITLGLVQDPSALDRAAADADAIVHCAALLPSAKASRADFFDTNMKGTVQAIETAIRRRMRKAIFFSTISVVDHVTRQISRHELFDYIVDSADPYLSSKIAAERAVMSVGHQFAGDFAIVRPAFIYGPGNFGVWRDAFQLLSTGRMRLIGKGAARLPLAHSDDVARYVLALLGSATIQDPIHVVANPEATTMRTVFDTLSELLYVPPPSTVPFGIALAAAYAAELLPASLRLGPLAILTKARVRQFGNGYDLSGVLEHTLLRKTMLISARKGLTEMAQDWRRLSGHPVGT
jgi:nucleoside-diphosphate-sugar epimerase